MPCSRSSQRPSVSAMSSGLGANTSNTSRPPGSSSAWAARRALSFSASSGMCSSERKGQMTSCTRSSTGGSRRSPTRRSTRDRDAVLVGERARDGQHPRGEVDPDHGAPRLRDGNGDPPGPDGQLDDRPVALLRLVDVERDVLDDRGAPRVVDPVRWSRRAPQRQCREAIRGGRVGTLDPSWMPTHSSAKDSPPQRPRPRRTRSRRFASSTWGARARSSRRCARCATARPEWR